MRRTTSPLASDCQSEAVGLIVVINRTGRELLMISKKSLPSSLEASQMPMYKGLRAREGDSFTLTSPSLHPPLFGGFEHKEHNHVVTYYKAVPIWAG